MTLNCIRRQNRGSENSLFFSGLARISVVAQELIKRYAARHSRVPVRRSEKAGFMFPSGPDRIAPAQVLCADRPRARREVFL
jgi:hypothetical protein